MKITILSVGKIKDTYWQKAINEYAKRIKAFAILEFIDIDNKAFKDPENAEVVKIQEAEMIEKRLEKLSGIIIALDEHEKEFSSQEFSQFLEKKSSYGDSIIFLLGGPRGLHSSLLKKAHHKMSLSRMTFPHNLAKVILVEQIYRAITISNGKSYHY